MWQDLFRRADLIARLAQSPCNPYLDEFVAFLGQQHYSAGTIRSAVVAADHFTCWLSDQQQPLSEASTTLVAQYRQSLRRGASGRSRGLLLVLRFLEHKQLILPTPAALPETPVKRWLNRFDEHLERVIGAAGSTRRQYELVVSRFLQQRFGSAEPEWSQLRA